MSDTRPSRALPEAPAIGLVAGGAISVQFGAALATKLFHQIGPAGAVTLRLVIAAALMSVGAWIIRRVRARKGRDPDRPKLRWRRQDVAVALAFGLVLAAMNFSFYEAIDRIPLGAAVTVEFSGPLALSLVGSRRWLDGLWAAGAGAGVALLASLGGHRLDPAGLGLALLAGVFWVGYIVLSRQTGRRFDGLGGLTLAMTFGAIALLPIGLASAGSRLLGVHVLLIGGCVAVLSSAVPYSLELVALRRVTPRAFGVMLSLDPAVAAAAGAIILGQDLSGAEWIACALVMGANLGNSLFSREDVAAAVP
jgi:inner membrane transporter RhtA